jgi:hypothetical protein
MLVGLKLHPDSRCDSVTAIAVDVARQENGRVNLRYEVTGEIAGLTIPGEAVPARASELWKHTCFEAFALREDGGYEEFNFSPSTSWAAYQFDSYRAGMREMETPPPQVEVHHAEKSLILIAQLQLREVGRLGLSAVIETIDGDISYWALAHALGRPDFHHPDSFAIDLRSL